jgi:hypothetical protein
LIRLWRLSATPIFPGAFPVAERAAVIDAEPSVVLAPE